MSNNGNKWVLTPKQKSALPLFLQGLGVSQVADELNVNRKAVSKWMNKPLFRYELNLAFQKHLHHVIIQLANQQKKAFSFLEEILEDPEASIAEKIRAADLLLRHANSLTSSKPALSKIVDGDDSDVLLGSQEHGAEIRIHGDYFGPYIEPDTPEFPWPPTPPIPPIPQV